MTKKAVQDLGGAGLFNHHSSLESALRVAYPDVEWQPPKFIEYKRAPRGYWLHRSTQKARLKKIGKELGVKEVLFLFSHLLLLTLTHIPQLKGWYSISTRQVRERGGFGALKYHGTLEAALRAVYPEFPWEAGSFNEHRKAPHGFWLDNQNLHKVLEKVEKELGISQVPPQTPHVPIDVLLLPHAKPEDWYSITLADLKSLGFTTRIKKPRLAQLLSERYPGHDWERVFLLKGKYGQQKRLERAIRSLFPVITSSYSLVKQNR